MSNQGFDSFDDWWEWWLRNAPKHDSIAPDMLAIMRAVAEEAYDGGHTAGYRQAYG